MIEPLSISLNLLKVALELQGLDFKIGLILLYRTLYKFKSYDLIADEYLGGRLYGL
jgi:hypothetical protein